VWLLRSEVSNALGQPAALYADDAANVAHEYDDSEQNAGRDHLGLADSLISARRLSGAEGQKVIAFQRLGNEKPLCDVAARRLQHIPILPCFHALSDACGATSFCREISKDICLIPLPWPAAFQFNPGSLPRPIFFAKVPQNRRSGPDGGLHSKATASGRYPPQKVNALYHFLRRSR
jgi:hypothetical protein